MSKKFRELIGDKVTADTELLEQHYTDLSERIHKEMQDKIDEAFSAVIGDYMPFIASDLYANLFTQYGEWLCRDWRNVGAEFGDYKAKELRQKILSEHRDVLIVELNQDNLNKIKELEEALERERDLRRYYS